MIADRILEVRRLKQREYRDNNRQRFRERDARIAREWAQNNPERKKEIRRREYLKNREKYLTRAKAWREANPGRYRAQMQRSYERVKALRCLPRCQSCECLLKENDGRLCGWCKANT